LSFRSRAINFLGATVPTRFFCVAMEWEEVGQAGEQRLLAALVPGLVLQHFVSKGPTEVERLEDAIAVARVAKLEKDMAEITNVSMLAG
jgi:uncharacterized protein YqhQ